jgi:hypothetical protein
MIVIETLESDSGASSHLDQVEWSELVEQFVRDDPPFGVGSGRINKSGYIAAVPPPGLSITDRHVEPTPSAGPTGKVEKLQVHMFKCKRCGALDKAIPFSGFQITHQLFQQGKEFKHQVTKKPAEIGIRIPNTTTDIKAKGGFGSATSALQKISP